MKYLEYEQMMNNVGETLASEINGDIYIAFSGGLDSAAILTSLLHTTRKIVLVHIQFKGNNGSTVWNKEWENCMTECLGGVFDVPVVFLPDNRYKYKDEVNAFYPIFSEYGIDEIVTGDGMDRCYGEACHSTFGEDFRAFHPLFDMFFKTIPEQIKVYHKSDYRNALETDSVESKLGRVADKFNMKIYSFSAQPEYIQFFMSYVENVKDIVFPKQFTRTYVDKQLKTITGKTYNQIAKKAFVLNKSSLKSFGSRIIDKGKHHIKEE